MSRRLTFRNLVSLLIMLNILMLVIVFNANIVGGGILAAIRLHCCQLCLQLVETDIALATCWHPV